MSRRKKFDPLSGPGAEYGQTERGRAAEMNAALVAQRLRADEERKKQRADLFRAAAEYRQTERDRAAETNAGLVAQRLRADEERETR